MKKIERILFSRDGLHDISNAGSGCIVSCKKGRLVRVDNNENLAIASNTIKSYRDEFQTVRSINVQL